VDIHAVGQAASFEVSGLDTETDGPFTAQKSDRVSRQPRHRVGSTHYKLVERTAVLTAADDDEAVAGMQRL
jgi:hypothetical protein